MELGGATRIRKFNWGIINKELLIKPRVNACLNEHNHATNAGTTYILIIKNNSCPLVLSPLGTTDMCLEVLFQLAK